ncbi:MAG: N-acetylmuramoyl-L-alanine amidase [Candidatus Omnitrophica bacterium]|nr:N-acetylmuramoyl-L-alanine amidase [Candidatus Omnitrophota bacterium]
MIRKFSWLSVLLLFFAAGCATTTRMPGGTAAPLSLEGLCGKYAVDCGWDGVSQTVTMDYQGQKVQALVGSSTVMVGNTRVVLSAPLKRQHGLVIVPADFERLVFAPVSPGSRDGVSFAGHRLGKVIVDAGHGGKDPGAIGFGGMKEKDIDFDIAARVVKAFKGEGVDAILTRGKDDFISLAERTERASTPGADIFISIHANATKSHRAYGYEVYYIGALNAKDRAEDQRLQNEKILCRTLNMKQGVPELRLIVADMLYAYKMSDAARLAETVSQGLSQELGQGSRGSKTARYFVLRNTLIPAVLVEVGFITNPKDAMQLKDGMYRQRIADSVTKSVLRYVYATGR